MSHNPQRPDEPNQSSSQALPSDQDALTATESTALDALLHETIGNQPAPHLTGIILDRYHRESSVNVAVSTRPPKRPRGNTTSATGTRWGVGLLLAAVAASLIAMVFFGPGDNHSLQGQKGTLATDAGTTPHTTDSDLKAPQPPTINPPQEAVVDKPRKPTKAVVLEWKQPKHPSLNNTSPDLDSVPPSSAGLVEGKTPSEPRAIQLVSQQIKTDLYAYWSSAGIEPTSASDQGSVAKRLSTLLGTKVPSDILDSPEASQRWLSEPDVAAAVARSWWLNVTRGNLEQLSQKQQQAVVSKITECFSQSASIDQIITTWLRGDSEGTTEFFQSLAPRNANRTHPAFIANLGSLTMGIDVQCIRCHDGFIQGTQTQQDYWAFAAMLHQTTASPPKTSGNTKPQNAASSPRPLFYDLPDRRQKLATPQVSPHWVGTHGITTMEQFADRLQGSPELARGIVNSLWRLVHGRPLRGHVSHPLSAPMSDELAKIELDLIHDLMESQFNLRRTLAMIITSPTSHRSVPTSPRDVWAVDQSDAHRKAIAFAGSLPASSGSLAGKFAQSMRSIGATIDVRDPTLAQVSEGSPRISKPVTSGSFAWDFPDRADQPPVQWIHSVKGWDNKVKHLCYLGGYQEVPPLVAKATEAMRVAKVDELTLLNRVWWLAQSR